MNHYVEFPGENGYLKLEILEVYGFPNSTCFEGGYSCKMEIEIKCDCYYLKNTFYSSTGIISELYNELNKCNINLNGKANFSSCEYDVEFEIIYSNGKIEIVGKHQQHLNSDTYLNFEIFSDQSYFKSTLKELEKIMISYPTPI